MERMTVGTHQRHGSTQASASIVQAQNMVAPNGWTPGTQQLTHFFEEQAVVIYTSFSDGSG